VGLLFALFYFLIPVSKLKPNFPDYFAKDGALWILGKGKHLLTSHAITNLSRRLFSVILVNNIDFNSEFEYFKMLLIQNAYCMQMSFDLIMQMSFDLIRANVL
jgi:hypothetical protein